MVGLLTANFVFADWQYFYFLFILKDSFAKYRNCALAVFFLQFLTNIPLPLVSVVFRWWETCPHTICCPSLGNVSFSSGCFQDFVLFFFFRSLIVMCLGMGFFGFIMFGIHSASWICRLMSFATFEKFSVIISLNPLSAIVSCFLLWNFDVTNVGSSIIDTQILEILFLFACFLLFYFRLFSFSCSDCVKSIIIFSFTNSIISHLHSTIDLIQYLKRRRQWLPTPVLLPGQWTEEPGGLHSMGLLRIRRDWATSLSLSCIGEGNGNPLQRSCLENPRDGGAWWAAVYGVAQSQTWLKQLSSST